MLCRCRVLAAMLLFVLLAAPAAAQEGTLRVVATFSILADFVANVGGSRVAVTALVGPGADAHAYAPTPLDARRLAEADLIIGNGLGFEGWLARLVQASGSKAPVVEASAGIKPLKASGDHDHGHGHAHGVDPHAWQSVANAKRYVVNIRDALTRVDPAGAEAYAANAAAYLLQLDALDQELRATVATIPAARRRIVTDHDAFRYFEAAYGIRFIAVQGIAKEAAPSAREVARIITLIKRQKIPAVFLENVGDSRLMQRIADETGARIGGTLYSDALTERGGPAPTYIDLMRHNLRTLAAALATS